MTANELMDSFYLHDSSLTMITRSAGTAVLSIDLCLWAQESYRDEMPDIAPLRVTLSGVRELSLTIDNKTEELPERTVFADLPGVFDAEILEAKPLSDRKLLLCLFLTKKDEQVYAEIRVTADDFNPEVVLCSAPR